MSLHSSCRGESLQDFFSIKIFEIAKSKGGFDINDTLKGKATALHFAVQYKDLEFAEFLISNGADPNQSYRSGYGIRSGFSGPSTVISYTLRELCAMPSLNRY